MVILCDLIRNIKTRLFELQHTLTTKIMLVVWVVYINLFHDHISSLYALDHGYMCMLEMYCDSVLQ